MELSLKWKPKPLSISFSDKKQTFISYMWGFTPPWMKFTNVSHKKVTLVGSTIINVRNTGCVCWGGTFILMCTGRCSAILKSKKKVPSSKTGLNNQGHLMQNWVAVPPVPPALFALHVHPVSNRGSLWTVHTADYMWQRHLFTYSSALMLE